MELKKKLAIVFLVVLFSFFPARANAATVDGLSQKYICQCGCTSVLSNCTHAECMVRDIMTTVIGEKLAQGQSEAEITQFLIAQYGEQVLASPPKRGFNLVAWVLPFVALLLGAGVIYVALKKWVWQGRQSPATAGAEVEESDDEYRRRLEKELEEFTGSAFR